MDRTGAQPDYRQQQLGGGGAVTLFTAVRCWPMICTWAYGCPTPGIGPRFIYLDEHQRERRISGVTLPGTQVMVVGSNEQVAWGFTNTGGDWSDLVILEPGPDQDSYLTPDGTERFQHFQETIGSKDGPRSALRGALDPLGAGGGIPIIKAGNGLCVGWRTSVGGSTWVCWRWRRRIRLSRRCRPPIGLEYQLRTLLLAGADGRIAWTIARSYPTALWSL